jgi:putative transposase
MKSLLPLLLRLVQADHAALARQVEYLVVENRLLRAQISGPVRLTDRERARLVRFGVAVGPALKDLISIVKYDTFRRWARGVKRKSRRPKRPPGRPRTSATVEALVVRLARESGWGYTRILGELRKLGVKSISHGTVRDILKRHGVEPAPERRDPPWETFLRRHAETLWACDFFTTNVLTARGMRPASVLAFIHVRTRRVIVTKATFRPTRRWTADAAACVVGESETAGLPKPTIVVRDNDSKFGGDFDAELADQRIKAERLPVQAPLCNAHMERWIQSLRRECLDHFVPVGLRHLDHLVSEYLEHYHRERPNQGMGNRLLGDRPPGHDPPLDEGEVVCRVRLGGVLRHYERRRAA